MLLALMLPWSAVLLVPAGWLHFQTLWAVHGQCHGILCKGVHIAIAQTLWVAAFMTLFMVATGRLCCRFGSAAGCVCCFPIICVDLLLLGCSFSCQSVLYLWCAMWLVLVTFRAFTSSNTDLSALIIIIMTVSIGAKLETPLSSNPVLVHLFCIAPTDHRWPLVQSYEATGQRRVFVCTL